MVFEMPYPLLLGSTENFRSRLGKASFAFRSFSFTCPASGRLERWRTWTFEETVAQLIAHKRFLNIIVAALNYQYLGRATSLEEIRRCPNTWQRPCSDRLRTLIAACGTDPEPFSLAPGRSGPELGAALFQLEQFVELPEVAVGGYKGLYFQRFFDDPPLFPEELYPQLRPYRSLDASRLKLTGSGSWDTQKHIDGELWLPFVEPKFLLCCFQALRFQEQVLGSITDRRDLYHQAAVTTFWLFGLMCMTSRVQELWKSSSRICWVLMLA